MTFFAISFLRVGASGRYALPGSLHLLREKRRAAPSFALTALPVERIVGAAQPRPNFDGSLYAFSTCEKSSSTGVERPKIVTDTRSLLFS